jgi:hypothetical protein
MVHDEGAKNGFLGACEICWRRLKLIGFLRKEHAPLSDPHSPDATSLRDSCNCYSTHRGNCRPCRIELPPSFVTSSSCNIAYCARPALTVSRMIKPIYNLDPRLPEDPGSRSIVRLHASRKHTFSLAGQSLCILPHLTEFISSLQRYICTRKGRNLKSLPSSEMILVMVRIIFLSRLCTEV